MKEIELQEALQVEVNTIPINLVEELELNFSASYNSED